MVEYDWVTIQGQVPAKANNYKIVYYNGHPSLGKVDSVKAYETAFLWQMPPKMRNLEINKPFELYIRVYFTSIAHDLDNAIKTFEDCLQYSRTIKNDNKCMKIVAEKSIDKDNPRIEFKIIEL